MTTSNKTSRIRYSNGKNNCNANTNNDNTTTPTCNNHITYTATLNNKDNMKPNHPRSSDTSETAMLRLPQRSSGPGVAELRLRAEGRLGLPWFRVQRFRAGRV